MISPAATADDLKTGEELSFLSPARPSGLRSGVSSFLAMLIPLVIYLWVTPLLLSRLGAVRYGLLALFLAIPTALASADFGLVTGGVFAMGRMLKSGRAPEASRLHRELLSLFLILGFILGAALWLAAPRLAVWLRFPAAMEAGHGATLMRLAAACLFVSMLIEAACILPRALEQFPGLSLVQTASKVVLWLGIAGLALSGGGLISIALWTLCAGLLTLAVYRKWSRRSLWPSLSWRPALGFGQAATVFTYSFFAFAGQLSSAVSYHADKFIVAHFLGPLSAGYYAICTGITLKTLAVGGVVTSFVFPRAVALHAASEPAPLSTAASSGSVLEPGAPLRALYLRASRCNLLVLTPILLPALLLAHPLLSAWLGRDFARQATLPLQLLFITYFITALSVVPSYIYSGMGNSRVCALYATAGAALNAGFCLLLTPLLGIEGAAVADLIGALQSIPFMGSLEHSLGLGWFKSQGRLFGGLFLAGAAQAAVLLSAGAWIKGGALSLAAGFLAWALFYAVWFLTPSLSTQEDRALLSRMAGFCLDRVRLCA